MFVKHYCPLDISCIVLTCDLDLSPTDLNIDRGYLLIRGYLPISLKLLEQSVPKLSVAQGVWDKHDCWLWPLTYWPIYMYHWRSSTYKWLSSFQGRIHDWAKNITEGPLLQRKKVTEGPLRLRTSSSDSMEGYNNKPNAQHWSRSIWDEVFLLLTSFCVFQYNL